MLRFLRSRAAFYTLLGLFAFESLWIALSSRYPMAFDEYFHYGVAQLHTQTWAPFLTNVPDSASLYGAITRDPSFLYHYLLSFPLRLLQLITDNMVAQVINLRILNIGIAVGSLLVYAKLLRKLGLGQAAITVLLAFVCLIPVFPLMAGQISYDNLFFLMVATTLSLAVSFVQKFQAKNTIDVQLLNWLVLSALFTCFVKYAFLPALAAIVLIVGYIIVKNRKKVVKSYATWWHTSGRYTKGLFASIALLGALFFAGSYGVNLVKYHTPVPDCDAVLTEEACKSYGPWYRDYQAKQTHPGSTIADIPPYIAPWLDQMMYETFFVVGAKYNDQGVVTYFSTKPFPILLWAGWAILIVGVLIAVIKARFIWSRLEYRLIMAALLLYGIALFSRNLQFYLETGNAVAIHGRYVLPLMIPAIGVIAMAARQIKLQWLNRRLATVLVTLAFVSFLQGGLVTFIVATNDDWMWPQSETAKSVNSTLRDILSPLIYR